MKEARSSTHRELSLVCGKRLFYRDVNRRRIAGATSPNVYTSCLPGRADLVDLALDNAFISRVTMVSYTFLLSVCSFGIIWVKRIQDHSDQGTSKDPMDG